MLKNNTQKSVGYSQRIKSNLNLVNKRPVIINQKENTTACQTESNEDNKIIQKHYSLNNNLFLSILHKYETKARKVLQSKNQR